VPKGVAVEIVLVTVANIVETVVAVIKDAAVEIVTQMIGALWEVTVQRRIAARRVGQRNTGRTFTSETRQGSEGQRAVWGQCGPSCRSGWIRGMVQTGRWVNRMRDDRCAILPQRERTRCYKLLYCSAADLNDCR